MDSGAYIMVADFNRIDPTNSSSIDSEKRMVALSLVDSILLPMNRTTVRSFTTFGRSESQADPAVNPSFEISMDEVLTEDLNY